ncbi:MAG: replicative DNA helicase [Candidatus Peregrinibacteria bacterium]|nr:replicative DNA helicase [Candidatus Peregrinibacteria bacterium]
MAEHFGKIPPHSLDAERSILGSLFVDKEAIIKVSDILNADDFYHDIHGILYRSVMELYDRRMPIDVVTLTSYLEDRNQLDLVGGVSFIAELSTENFTSSHVVQYALIVKEKSTLRKLIRAGDTVMSMGYSETEPLEDLLEKSEKALFNVSQTFLKDKFVHVRDVLAQTFEKISNLHDPEAKQKYRGVPTGFADMDELLSGLQPSDLIVMAARPSMGKTALALNLAQNAAKRGFGVGVVSLEMSKEQLVERMFCSLLQVDSWKLRTGKLTDEDFARIGGVMDELNGMKIFIDDTSGSSIAELRAKARRLQMENGLDMLIIDYMQLMSMGSGMGVNRVQEISEISRALKHLARELHIPIVVLSQLSRAVESRPVKIPQLSDLRESGAIEQDADVVMMLYREDYYEEDSQRKGILDVYVKKHRNGPTGRIELMFKKEQMRFITIEKSKQSQNYAMDD